MVMDDGIIGHGISGLYVTETGTVTRYTTFVVHDGVVVQLAENNVPSEHSQP